MKITTVVSVAILAMVCAAAHADVIQSSDTQLLPNDATTTLNLAKFHGNLSDLTGVYVQIELRLTGAHVQLDNDADQAQSGTGRVVNAASSLTSTVSLLKVDLDTINTGDLTINASQVFPLDATTGDTVGAFNATHAADYANWEPGTITAGDAGNISSLVWADYVGSGNFTISVKTTYLTSATFVGNDGYFEGNTPDGEIYAQVIYTSVPEPISMALLAVGGLAMLRRRRA